MDPTWQILATKLYLPPPTPTLVARPRLLEKLQVVFHHPVTAIITPAGFGKTTLVSSWAAQVIAKKTALVAWLALDAYDDNPAHFWTSVVAALRTIKPALGQEVLPFLKAMTASSDEATLVPLLNQLADHAVTPIVLVLDDFHVISNAAIHSALTFFIDHIPPRVHLIVNSRSEPSLPLARLRAKGQLAELRAADLRFTPEEVAHFLNDVMGLKLAPALIAALETRTEGWIAGLHLAALSLQNHTNHAEFVRSLTGSHRYIMDYLVEEVLQRQPGPIRAFLLQTAILDRLCAPLCDAVTDGSGSADLLSRVESANLFLIPLDDERRWYRYHQLFVETLRARLAQEQAALIPELHRRASIWYAQHAVNETAMQGEAIRHALAAGDGERAVRLVGEVADVLWARNELTTLQAWLTALPEAVLYGYPRQAIMLAQIVAMTGSYNLVPLLLDAAATALAKSALPDPEQATLSGRIAAIRANVARVADRLDEAVALAEQALTLLPGSETTSRGLATLCLAVVHQTRGELSEAEACYRDTIGVCEAGGDRYFEITARCMHSRLFLERGDPAGAEVSFRHALGRATYGTHRLQIAGWALIGLGTVAYERNELQTSDDLLTEGLELARHSGLRNANIYGLAGLIRLRLAQADLENAQATALQMVLATRASQILHYMRWATALQALVDLRRGDLPAAIRWAHGFRPRPEALLFTDKAAFAVFVRVLLAQGQTDLARQWIAEQRRLAMPLGHIQTLIELHLLEVTALAAAGQRGAARVELEAALVLAEPTGLIRPFLDAGEVIGTLLAERAGQPTPDGRLARYLNDLLASFRLEEALVRLAQPASAPRQPLTEPLSERELEVLRLMAAGLSNQAIADQLVISVPTVKKHGSNILGKLHAANRTEAVRRARELGLLA